MYGKLRDPTLSVARHSLGQSSLCVLFLRNKQFFFRSILFYLLLTFVVPDLCNHDKSWQFLVDSTKYPGSLLGTYAKSYRAWKNYSKPERFATVLEIGKYYDNV